MKKIILIAFIFLVAGILSAKDKYYAEFEFNGKKYECKVIYERSDLIPTYKLNIRATDLKTRIVTVSNLIIKKQAYSHNSKKDVETWERFLKRKASHRIPKEITFHIVGENKSYATFIFGRNVLSEYFFNEDLCLIEDRDKRIFIYQNESVLFAVIKQFLKGTNCLPNETTVSKL